MADMMKSAILAALGVACKTGGTTMDEQPQAPPAVTYSVVLPEAPQLPLLHVNVLSVRAGVDEIFLTFGAVIPPEFKTPAEVQQAAAEGMPLEAQTLFRCAVSPEAMKNFVALMQAQLQAQSAAAERLAKQRRDAQAEQQEGIRHE
jgi:hypothetical protein